MNVTVVGPGAIGRFVGGRLADIGCDVTFIGREASVAQLGTEGFTVRDGQGDPISVATERFVATTTYTEASSAEVVLVCVKSSATASVADRLAEVMPADAVVVSLQNGLQNAPAMKERLSACQIVPGVVSFNVVSEPGGDVRRTMDGTILLGCGEHPTVRALVTQLKAAGIDARAYGDLAPHQWTKLLVNLNNALSALSGEPTVQLLGSRRYRRIMAAVLDEALAVFRHAGIRPARLRGVPIGIMPMVLRWPTALVRLFIGAQMRIDPEARSSMWEDLQRRNRTEIDVLNGEIVALAARCGAPAPINTKICALVEQAEAAAEGSPQMDAPSLEHALGL